jgi:hypothetical protein
MSFSDGNISGCYGVPTYKIDCKFFVKILTNIHPKLQRKRNDE